MRNINIQRGCVWLEAMSDFASITIGYLVSSKVFGCLSLAAFLFYLMFLCVSVFFLIMLDAYDDLCSYLTQKKRLPVTLAVSCCLSLLAVLLIILVIPFLNFFRPAFYMTFFIMSYALLILGRMAILCLMIKKRKGQALIILYYPNCPEKFLNKLKIKAADYGKVYLCMLNFDKIENAVEEKILKCDKVLILENVPGDLRDEYILYSLQNGKETQVIPTVENLSLLGGRIRHIGDTPVISLKNAALMPEEKIIKRCFDFCAALAGLVITSPLFLICAAAIKLDSKGAVFYKQERYTINKKRFNIYKFRTMVEDAERHGHRLATENDERITRVGKVLRALRIDELPQLVNILKGEMSFVGPRPERPVYADVYSKIVKNYDVRYLVKAGLTGYAQIYGQYNTKVSDKVLFDSIYINNFSLWLDLKLIVQTAMIMFIKESTEGVEQDMAFVPSGDRKESFETAEKK